MSISQKTQRLKSEDIKNIQSGNINQNVSLIESLYIICLWFLTNMSSKIFTMKNYNFYFTDKFDNYSIF